MLPPIAGDVIQEVLGEYAFKDVKNSLTCCLYLNQTKHLPSDVFVGSIHKVNQEGEALETLCEVDGSFLGFLDFAGVRYSVLDPIH